MEDTEGQRLKTTIWLSSKTTTCRPTKWAESSKPTLDMTRTVDLSTSRQKNGVITRPFTKIVVWHPNKPTDPTTDNFHAAFADTVITRCYMGQNNFQDPFKTCGKFHQVMGAGMFNVKR
ncbi:hypothetical protein FF38_12037 [Lucilia cuprina]|uniref:Uncharacterized protein n=1 Tax=Lucilia cuprina TaxID=7375 RepID=A0A0L0BLQ4_LUCCU|nr:hypothetical protein FF38_12037 [Lucilia cuprina]